MNIIFYAILWFILGIISSYIWMWMDDVYFEEDLIVLAAVAGGITAIIVFIKILVRIIFKVIEFIRSKIK